MLEHYASSHPAAAEDTSPANSPWRFSTRSWSHAARDAEQGMRMWSTVGEGICGAGSTELSPKHQFGILGCSCASKSYRQGPCTSLTAIICRSFHNKQLMKTAAVAQPPECQQRPDRCRSHQLGGFGFKEASGRLKTCRKPQVRQSKGLKG